MKSIRTRFHPLTGGYRATAGDGHSCIIPPTEQYEDAHRKAAFALCRKMGWTGTLIGAHVLSPRGVTDGMVWVWDDPRSPRVTIDPDPPSS